MSSCYFQGEGKQLHLLMGEQRYRGGWGIVVVLLWTTDLPSMSSNISPSSISYIQNLPCAGLYAMSWVETVSILDSQSPEGDRHGSDNHIQQPRTVYGAMKSLDMVPWKLTLWIRVVRNKRGQKILLDLWAKISRMSRSFMVQRGKCAKALVKANLMSMRIL